MMTERGSLAEIARTHTETALETLAWVCKHGFSEAARVRAAEILLDRGHGKAEQRIEVHERTVKELTRAELMAIAGQQDGLV